MDDAESIGKIINDTFSNITENKAQNAYSTLNVWKKILMRIKSNRNPNEGQNLADHSRVIDLKNGVLLVEADHSAWIELLQLHKNYILKGIQMEKPKLNVENIVFRLKGKKADIYDFDAERKTESEVLKEIEKKAQKEEEILKKSGFTSENENIPKKEVSPEFAALLEDFKNDILKG